VTSPVTLLIAGGGTGGHVFPMIAVGDAAKAIDPRTRVVYVGTSRGIEVRVMGERGDDLRLLDVAPLRGHGALGFVKGVSRAAAAIPGARALVQSLRPNAVLSLGGYAAGPVSLAARTLGVPVTMLEPNAVLGLSNRLLAPFTERAYVAFPETERSLRPSTVRRFGVPLRRAFAPIRLRKEGRLRIARSARFGREPGREGAQRSRTGGDRPWNRRWPRSPRRPSDRARSRGRGARALPSARPLGSRARRPLPRRRRERARRRRRRDRARGGRRRAASSAPSVAPASSSRSRSRPTIHQRKNAESLERAGAVVTPRPRRGERADDRGRDHSSRPRSRSPRRDGGSRARFSASRTPRGRSRTICSSSAGPTPAALPRTRRSRREPDVPAAAFVTSISSASAASA